VWEGPVTRARRGEEISRVYPGGTLESNCNLLYRVAARLRDPETQAVADRCRAFGHTSLEEHWTLLWRDAALAPAPMSHLPLRHRFEDSGVVFFRTSWEKDALAFAFKAGPPEGHRAARLLAQVPEWRSSTGHSHPDAGSFIVWSGGHLVVGDTGYAGKPLARHHNTIVVGEFGQGMEKEHDAWEGMDRAALDRIRITEATLTPTSARIVADLAAAYPPGAGLTTLRRELSFEAPGRFRVRDRVETSEPRLAAWYLHADRPFTLDGTSFSDREGDILDGSAVLPAGARLRMGPTILTAPGQPGSIEQGRPDQRGFEIVIEPAAAGRATEFDVTFGVKR
jgi:hypothetical protein